MSRSCEALGPQPCGSAPQRLFRYRLTSKRVCCGVGYGEQCGDPPRMPLGLIPSTKPSGNAKLP